jgi:hypothetical protein
MLIAKTDRLLRDFISSALLRMVCVAEAKSLISRSAKTCGIRLVQGPLFWGASRKLYAGYRSFHMRAVSGKTIGTLEAVALTRT